jgi:cell wall-associated NlpC family hydrolase
MAETSAETFDPRITPARPDLAARYLQGKVDAARFVDGERREITTGIAPLRQGPGAHDTQLTEALRGEIFTIYDQQHGWSWGQLDNDKYVGWVLSAALGAPGPKPTHKVAALSTLAFPGPSIKLPPAAHLPLGSRLVIVGEKDTFAITPEGWHVPARHLVPLARHETDFVAVAVRFLEAPYLWGGKTAAGLDCSGLVQIALDATGIDAPRDSDMQERALGRELPPGTMSKRGDLIFWKGHVAIVRDADTMVHANAFHMKVAVEPISDGIKRIAAAGSAVTSIKRL